jgi:hypothetical protein
VLAAVGFTQPQHIWHTGTIKEHIIAKGRDMLRNQLAVILLLLVTGGAQAATDASRVSVEAGMEQFHWREYGPAHVEWVDEQGERIMVSVNYDNLRRLDSGNVFRVGGKLYLGAVDYDGETQISGIPVQSTSNYLGMSIEGTGGYRFARRLKGLDLLAGAGLDFWWRSIEDSYVSGLGWVYGGDEDYFVFYARAGLGFFHELGPMSYRIEAGVKYPFFVTEYAYPMGSDDITLNPKGRASLYANYKMEFGPRTRNHIGLTIYYDRYLFKQSDLEPETVGGVATGFAYYQPESHQQTLGVQLGFYFR